uniref:Mannosyltransferase n=3 Tax=Schistocephalus solidus TaxID=70667 RepID=A0A0X3PFG8_SCHSO
MSAKDIKRTVSEMKKAGSDKLQTQSPSTVSSLLLPLLILFRIFNALIIRTTFVPDEYWQSIEVAHRWAFGYGALTWEWWNSTAIRSPLHPLMFAGLYKLLAAVGFDSRLAIIYLPRLLHGILAAVADYNLYGLTNLISDPTTAKVVLPSRGLFWWHVSFRFFLKYRHAITTKFYPHALSFSGLSSPSAPTGLQRFAVLEAWRTT